MTGLVGEFDRSYYERNYRSYELQNPPRKLAFYRALVERAAAGKARPRILEIGCAFGHFLATLDPRWRRCGMDASRYAVGRARRRAPEAAFAVADAGGEIPFAGGFDVIVAFDVLEHLADLARVREALLPRLAPGGRLVFVVPVYDGPTGPLVRLLDRDPTHVHKRSRAFWLDWAGRDLRIVEWWGVYRYLLPGGRYLHRPTRALRGVAPAVAVVAARDDGDGGGEPRAGAGG